MFLISVLPSIICLILIREEKWISLVSRCIKFLFHRSLFVFSQAVWLVLSGRLKSFMTAFGGTNPLKDIFITAGFLFILEVTHTVSCFLANKTCSNASWEKAAELLQKDFIHCILVIPNVILKGWSQQKHSE